MSRTRGAKNVNTGVRSELIDEITNRYLEWREQCIALRKAYEGWSVQSGDDRRLAFEAYKAALDMEEHASRVYEDRVSRLTLDLRPRLQRAALLGEAA
jgi:hypothetical protein